MDGSSDVSTKIFELAYALVRISSRAGRLSPKFAEYYCAEALSLVKSCEEGNHEAIRRSLNIVESLSRLGQEAGWIFVHHAEAVIAAAQAVGQSLGDAKGASEDFEIFPPAPTRMQPIFSPQVQDANGSQKSKWQDKEDFVADKRQELIVSLIKRKGDCHLKDITSAMPSISERTIRYDLQKLIEIGRVERIGGGGPFSYFRVKEPVSFPTEVA
jgi:hypothetical protein